MRLLKEIGELADEMGYPAFIVGGTVRDLLLGTKNIDIDIVVEGDAIKLGKVFAEKMFADIIIHKYFGTCSVTTKAGERIDFATARRETYKRPGAMPTVEFSSLKDDLSRRDFTVNAMAISINDNNCGKLIDFFGGEKDLASKHIRVLHDKSFIDDPTRIFRAVRFEKRFGFAIERRTLKLIKDAIKKEMPGKVSRGRVKKELDLIDKEKNKLNMLNRLEELNLWRYAAL